MKFNNFFQFFSVMVLASVLTACNSSSGDGNSTEVTAEEALEVVDASDLGVGIKGLKKTDTKGNEIITYVVEGASENDITITEGVDPIGEVDGYLPITNQFIEIAYPSGTVGRQAIKVVPQNDFNAVITFDAEENLLIREPFSTSEDGSVDFRPEPVNGSVVFSLMLVSE